MGHRALRSVAGVKLLLLLVACGDEVMEPEPPRPTAISISPNAVELAFIGEMETFTATVTNQYGAAFPEPVTWHSDAPEVFSVSSNGVVVAVANGVGGRRSECRNHRIGAPGRRNLRSLPRSSRRNQARTGAPGLYRSQQPRRIAERVGELVLSYNELKTLPAEVFAELSQMYLLILEHNQLAELPPNLLSGASNLFWLRLHHNQLKQLPDGMFVGLRHLESLCQAGGYDPETLRLWPKQVVRLLRWL